MLNNLNDTSIYLPIYNYAFDKSADCDNMYGTFWQKEFQRETDTQVAYIPSIKMELPMQSLDTLAQTYCLCDLENSKSVPIIPLVQEITPALVPQR